MHEGESSYRSQIAYVGMVAVLVISAMIIVIWDSPATGAVLAGAGLVGVALTLRSGIFITDEGIKLCGFLRTAHLRWSEVDAFTVAGSATPGRSVLRTGMGRLSNPNGANPAGVSLGAISAEALTVQVPMLSTVAVITTRGERLRIPGTASTPLDPDFPAEAAAELNRMLKRRNPSATVR